VVVVDSPEGAAEEVAAVAAEPVGAHYPDPIPIIKRRDLTLLATVGIPIASLGVLIVLGLWFESLGSIAIWAGLLALIPLGIVLWGALWIDRWEPEPKRMLTFAFLWGAGFSALIGVFVGAEPDQFEEIIAGAGTFIVTAIQAPIIEETAKGFVVLLMFLLVRRRFDGPVDGIVYATWSAAGFAFVENILYFGNEIANPSGDVASIFIVRGLMSPFAHVMFTAVCGAIVGIAARKGATWWQGIGAWLLGLIPAIGLHALWNGALFVVTDFVSYYALFQLPLFVAMVLVVMALRREERRITLTRLLEFEEAGWFAPGEAAILATSEGRQRMRRWARASGHARMMDRYIRMATNLAFARQREHLGRDPEVARHEEREALDRIQQLRLQMRA